MDKYGQIADFVHFLMKGSYGENENLNFLDLTCGNGKDTLFLSNLVGPSGQVTAFDIQSIAIERTKELLIEKGKYQNYILIKDSHEYAEKYLKEKIDAAVFNLGYLPQSDKEISTKAKSTIKSINLLLPYLKDSGRIYVAAYIGHDKGFEISKVFEYLNNLNKKEFNVLNIKLINKDNNPPQLFIVEKNS